MDKLERFNYNSPNIESRNIIILIVILLIAFIGFLSVGRINVGQVAVIQDPILGRTTVVGTGENAQYYFKPPWTSTSTVYIATDSVNMRAEGRETGDFPAVESLTQDGLRVYVDITVRWTIKPEGVLQLYRNYPRLDWKDKAIIPIIRETIRNELVDYTAIQTIEQRESVGISLRTNLVKAFQSEETLVNSVQIEAVNIRNFVLPDTFVRSIEAKLAAEQLSIAAEFNKTRQLVLANATAQSAIIEAEGLSRSRLLLANASRDAIKILIEANPELDPTTLTQQYLYLETLRDISESGKSQFLIIPEESQYILPIK
ncbi:hypothetical protein GF326_00785 [Candidatus Bathyarchaeota archaeon]|nr:hypothetical protein [Candidatus Bathyarchaeota archaeon]